MRRFRRGVERIYKARTIGGGGVEGKVSVREIRVETFDKRRGRGEGEETTKEGKKGKVATRRSRKMNGSIFR